MKNWKKRFIAFITCIVFSIVSLPIVSAAEKIDNNFDKEIIALSQLQWFYLRATLSVKSK